jgi:hypothetical protein
MHALLADLGLESGGHGSVCPCIDGACPVILGRWGRVVWQLVGVSGGRGAAAVGRPAGRPRERVGLRRVGGEVAWVNGGLADGCELSTRVIANGYAAG